MTSASATLIEAAAPRAPAALWRGRLAEFLVVGGATLLLFPIAWISRWTFGLDSAELAFGFVTFHLATVINDPHFAVTYLLFYRDARRRAFGGELSRVQRLRYLAAGVIVPIALAGWAAAALITRSAEIMGSMIQLMFLLVGWHYVKQGFGVLSVLSARRGVSFSLRERRVILAHCYAGWAYAWASPFDPGKLVEEKGVVYRTLTHPQGLERATQLIFFSSVVPLVWVLVAKWRREGRLPPLAPLFGLLVTVWIWTVYSGIDPLMRYAIPALHSLQYLYFVWLLRRNEARAREGPPSFGRPAAVEVGFLAVGAIALGWLLFRGAPSFLDDAFASTAARRAVPGQGMGPTPFFAALFVFVNIHHYFMDAVIWRKGSPEARYLLQ